MGANVSVAMTMVGTAPVTSATWCATVITMQRTEPYVEDVMPIQSFLLACVSITSLL